MPERRVNGYFQGTRGPISAAGGRPSGASVCRTVCRPTRARIVAFVLNSAQLPKGSFARSAANRLRPILGYFGGSRLGQASAQAWYRSFDRKLKRRVDEWIQATPTPL